MAVQISSVGVIITPNQSVVLAIFLLACQQVEQRRRAYSLHVRMEKLKHLHTALFILTWWFLLTAPG